MNEGSVMNWLVFHIVSGQAFFSGICLLILAGIASHRELSFLRRMSLLLFLVGCLAIIISSTAIPYWYYATASIVSVIWIVSIKKPKWHLRFSYAMIAVWIGAGSLELPYHLMPNFSTSPARKITVIGDSVTAGVGGDEHSQTWPNILQHEHKVKVQDISHMGETASSALKRAQTHGITSQAIIIEIGGNDLLGSTSSAQFEVDLDALLSFATREDRQVIMFELPLPPFCHEFGRIQRTVAAKHGVKLIPKRVFLSVIASGDSTLDSIHLSQSGHQQMSNTVWQIIQPGFVASD